MMKFRSAIQHVRTPGVVLISVAALLVTMFPLAACTSNTDDIEVPGIGAVPEATPSGPNPESTVAPPSSPSSEPSANPSPSVVSTPTATTPPSLPPPITAPVEASIPPSTADTTVYYRQGDSAPEIEVMQLKLITLSYLAPGSANGTFDAATESALRTFQSDYALGVDGVFGPLTNRSLTAAANSVDLEPG